MHQLLYALLLSQANRSDQQQRNAIVATRLRFYHHLQYDELQNVW